MTPELIQQVIGNFVVASLIYFFLSQRVTELKADNAALKAELKRIQDLREEDLQRQLRKRTGDTAKLPELPPEEVEKFKNRMK